MLSFYISGKENPENSFYNSENRTFKAQKMKKAHLVGQLRVFHHCFFRCYHFTINFQYCFWVFYCWLHLFSSLFLEMFLFHQLSLHLLLFVTSFLCCCNRQCYGFETAFFTLRYFLLDTSSRNLAFSFPAFIKASLGQVVQPWRLQGFPLRFETHTWFICLFELHSV